jgi:hypothetical protein
VGASMIATPVRSPRRRKLTHHITPLPNNADPQPEKLFGLIVAFRRAFDGERAVVCSTICFGADCGSSATHRGRSGRDEDCSSPPAQKVTRRLG